jgi:hypothetical protein
MTRKQLLIAVAAAAFAWYNFGSDGGCPDGRCPAPTPKVDPAPPPQPKPRRPWGPRIAPVGADGIQAGGPVGPDGTEVTVDLPVSVRTANVGGSDGAGLCVFTSIGHAARWQNVPQLEGFRDWMRKYPGGGYPDKVDKMIARLVAEKGCEPPAYIQYSGGDPSILELALRTGRMPSVTYNGRDGVLYRGTISHMVNLVHLDAKWGVILDNNNIEENRLLWLPRDEFLKRWRGGGGGWAVVLLSPPPPPIPHNREVVRTSLTPYEWRFPASLPNQGDLYQGETHLGSYNYEWDQWRGWDQETGWGPVATPPTCPPVRGTRNYGVDPERCPHTECYTINGRKVQPATARRVLAGGVLSDDSTKLRLTVVGSDELCKRVKDDLATSPALAPYRDRLLIQAYPTGHWAVAGVGIADGITLQSAPGPDGRAVVLHRQADYSDGAAGLAEAVRKADGRYKPESDVDLRKLLGKVEPWMWVAGGLFVLMILKKDE